MEIPTNPNNLKRFILIEQNLYLLEGHICFSREIQRWVSLFWISYWLIDFILITRGKQKIYKLFKETRTGLMFVPSYAFL